jgi:alkylated DNA repair dioxygenase AlkB
MPTKIKKLADKGRIEYIDDFIPEDEANNLYDALIDDVPWEHGEYKMFGKAIQTPRLLYAMRDKNDDITDSYKVTGSMTWTKSINKIKKKIEKQIGLDIRYAQLNYYRDGDDYIGWHTDSEVRDGDLIASLSLGAERIFKFRHIDYKTNEKRKRIHSLCLENGSLLVMNEYAAKKKWKHTLPKMKNVEGRINITFRLR